MGGLATGGIPLPWFLLLRLFHVFNLGSRMIDADYNLRPRSFKFNLAEPVSGRYRFSFPELQNTQEQQFFFGGNFAFNLVIEKPAVLSHSVVPRPPTTWADVSYLPSQEVKLQCISVMFWAFSHELHLYNLEI